MSLGSSQLGSGRRKVAIALVALGPERSGPILRGMSEQEVRKVSLEIANLGSVSPDEVRSTLNELQQDLSQVTSLPPPGPRFARDLLVTAFGTDRGAAIAADLDRPQPFAWLASADAGQAAEALGEEPPAVVALALAHLPGRGAARILTRLPEAMRVDVATRIAALSTVHPDTVQEVDAGLQHRVTSLLVSDVLPVAGAELLADLLSFTGRDDEKAVLESLSTSNPELAEAVKAALLTFDDLAALEPRSLQVLLKAVETRELAVALKSSDDATLTRILGNISERGRESLLEEIDLLSTVKPSEIRSARQSIVTTARKLEEEGTLTIGRGEEEE